MNAERMNKIAINKFKGIFENCENLTIDELYQEITKVLLNDEPLLYKIYCFFFTIHDDLLNGNDEKLSITSEMFTRIGDNSKIVINGDPSQIDLPNKNSSGLDKSKKL